MLLTALVHNNISSLADSLFSKLDDNQGCLIQKIDFASSLAKLDQRMKKGVIGMPAISEMSPPPPDEVFDTVDENDNGCVSKDEQAAVLVDKKA